MVKFDRFILQEKDFQNASNHGVQKKKDKKFPYKSSYLEKNPYVYTFLEDVIIEIKMGKT